MAYDAFLKIDGIEGENRDGTIEVMSFSWGLSEQTSRGEGGGAGRVSVSDLSVMKSFDKSSPKLFEACATGQHFPSATLTLRKAGGDAQPQPFMFLKLSQVLISSAQQSGSEGGGDAPTESISLSFQKWVISFDKA